MISRELIALGLTWEDHDGKKCYNKNYMPKAYIDYPNEQLQDSNVYNIVRDVKQCDKEAGLIPCNLVTFHDVYTPEAYVRRVKKLVNHIKTKCNVEWGRHMKHLVHRY